MSDVASSRMPKVMLFVYCVGFYCFLLASASTNESLRELMILSISPRWLSTAVMPMCLLWIKSKRLIMISWLKVRTQCGSICLDSGCFSEWKLLRNGKTHL
jgi:hypothetical protein